MTRTIFNSNVSEVKNKISDTSSLVTTTVLNAITKEVENKISVRTKYITTQKFNKLTTEKIAARFKQAKIVSKTDFDNKLISFTRKSTSNQNI